MTREYSPIQDMLLALNRIVEKSGMSLREITRKLEKEGFNINNVCSVANGKPEKLSTILKYDSYVSGILRVTGHDEYDLVKTTLEELTNPNSKTFEEQLSIELKNFLRNPESEKYIEYAYKRYKLDKLKEEQEQLKKELEDI